MGKPEVCLLHLLQNVFHLLNFICFGDTEKKGFQKCINYEILLHEKKSAQLKIHFKDKLLFY